MRPIRRESSIFSVSAIDLFASALGAFIVVALVLLPYFPNTSDVQVETEAETERELEEPAPAPAAARTSPSVQVLPPIDLIIALDTTGSMFGEVASLREEIAGLSELLVDLTDDAAVGLIDFKDGCGGQPALRVAPLQQIDRRSVVHLAAFARSMSPGSASCNSTPDEDFAEALQAAVNSPWRQGSELRSIVLISDNPAHTPMRDQAVADAREFSNRPGARHTVSTVFVTGQDSARRSYPDTAVFMRQVALAGKGEFVRSSESASLSVTILRAIFG